MGIEIPKTWYICLWNFVAIWSTSLTMSISGFNTVFGDTSRPEADMTLSFSLEIDKETLLRIESNANGTGKWLQKTPSQVRLNCRIKWR